VDEQEIDRLETHALSCLAAGELAEALECLRRVIGVRRTERVAAALRSLAGSFLKRGIDASSKRASPGDSYRQCLEAYAVLGETIDTPVDRETVRVACFNLGAIAHRAGFVQDAMTYYRDALLLEPGEAGASVNLAILLTITGHADEAVAILQQALARQPEFIAIHSNLINALYESGDTKGAVAATREAAQRFPDMRFQHRAMFYPNMRRPGSLSA
jgi:tetratricopeptide (TPR) repeat protein